MQSAIEICNAALTTYLGTQSIVSLEAPSPEAEACKLHYDRVRRSLLERWPWLWASRREVLVQEAINDRAPAWSFKYARPGHLLRIQWVNEPIAARHAFEGGQSQDTPREVTAKAIYSDTAGAVIEYTRDEKDTTLFSAAFSDALAASLAAAIAMAIKTDRPTKQDAQRDAQMLLNQAMADDFNQRPAREMVPLPDSLAVRGLR